MKVKKLISGVLALGLAMSMGLTAFAETSDNYTDASTATLKKSYEAANAETTSPEETFAFSALTCTNVEGAASSITKENAPVPTIGSVEFGVGAAGSTAEVGNVTITLPEYTSVGIYTYSFNEIAGKTAGVTYNTNNFKLVVTVINGTGDNLLRVAGVHAETAGGEKTDTFTNTYSAGSLSVTKEVTGNFGDKSKEFSVDVTFKAPEGKTVASTISYEVGTQKYTIEPSEFVNGTVTKTITVKHGSTVTFTNIPYGVTYSVAEQTSSSTGYKVSYDSNQNGTISTASVTTKITNNKGTTPDTGVSLDSLPYIMMLAIAGVGLVVFAAKKRSMRED